jgi:signal transduction histidine kinase
MRAITTRQFGVDAAAAGLFALISIFLLFVPSFLGWSSRAHLVPILLLSAALVFRRLAPGVMLAVAWTAAFVQLGSGLSPSFYDVGICAVLFAAAAYGGPVVRWLGLGSAIVGAFIATAYLIVRFDWFGGLEYLPRLFPGQLRDFSLLFVGALALLVLSWVSGMLVRSRRAGRDALEREEEARQDVALAEYRVVVEQERNRIARDMHDVVAHTLAVVIAQADGARFAASTRPELAVDALGTISGVARDALGDVRLLLAELRHDEGSAPQPGAADFETLFAQLRAAGLDVHLREEGEHLALGAAREMAAYRIIQEGLTNALRHGAPGEPVEVTLIWTSDALHIELVNAVLGQTGTQPVGVTPGHGLPGMHERAQLAGGALLARADGDGRFIVRAWIPTGAAA